MSKFKFLKGRDDYYRHFSAVDIGTELVKVLVVRREGPEGVVLGVGREPQHPEAMEAGAIANPDRVIDACNRALEASEDMAGVVPGQAVVGIAGELVKGFSSAVNYPRARPDQRVRESELKNMLQMVERRALREAQHLLEMERSYGQMEPRLVQSAITQVRMDGYPVANVASSVLASVRDLPGAAETVAMRSFRFPERQRTLTIRVVGRAGVSDG